MRRRLLLLLLFLHLTLPAGAIIVRGKVTTPLGVPIPGARIQLIQGRRSVADTIAGIDGLYEIRIDLAGRFLLLTSAASSPARTSIQIGNPFYAGRTDLLNLDIALDPTYLTPQSSTQPNLVETPLPQLPTRTTQVRADQLITQAQIIPELTQAPSSFLVQMGQTGAPAFLYLRGASPSATKTLIDDVSAEDLGGRFQLSTLSPSGLSAISPTPALELTPSPNPLYGFDAEAGVLSLRSASATNLQPSLTYSGDAGNLDTLRNEGILSLTHTRTDLLVAFARFDTANSIPASPFPLASSSLNLGYHISGGSSLRLTLRNDLSAGALPSPFSFFAVAPTGRLADQNLYAAATFDTRTAGNWHNLLRFGLARKREQAFNFFTPVAGLPVTIAGANGYTAGGTATFPQLPPREDLVTNRDEYTYQTDYRYKPWLTVLLTTRYQDERGADLLPATPAASLRLERTHLSFAGSLQGQFARDRLFYTASGLLDHSPQFGLRGAPRLGLTYIPVRPGTRRLRGSALHLTAATGLREPSLLEQAAQPLQPVTPRSRTLDLSVDQNLLAQKLILHAGYFHNQFSHDFEALAPLTLSPTLAYRTQGVESDLRYQPLPRVFLHAGYTFLAAFVERSVATPTFNPNLPNLPIGITTALPGSRPFHRPTNTATFAAEYTGPRLNLTLKAALAGRSDDSTNLSQTPTLLLPNRNLSPGYTALDAGLVYKLSTRLILFTQLTNLLDDRHIAPIGFLSTPFLIRTGLRIRLGGE